MNTDSIEQIVIDHAPILHFHPNEGQFCCYPSDAEEVFDKYSERWEEFIIDMTPNDLNPDTPVYYEYWNDLGFHQIRYWFWYKYNRFPGAKFGLGEHLGDWEHVEVRIFEKHEKQPKVVVWLVSNHLEFRIASSPNEFTLKDYETKNPILTGTQLNTWVALGSHAHYLAPDDEPYCVLKILCDRFSDGGEVWNTRNSLIPLSSTNFYNYTGRWGDKKAPRSPTNEYNNRWRNIPALAVRQRL